MSIFILEDDIIQAEDLKRVLGGICANRQIPYDFIYATAKGERLLDKMTEAAMNAIYFLDVEIKGEQHRGFQLAQQIRERDEQGIIVFITTHYEFAPISYQYMVSALTFIDKGLDEEARYKSLEACLLHYQSSNSKSLPADDFVMETAEATVRLPFAEVEYIMTAGPHRLELVAKNRIIHFYGQLKKIEQLDDRLIRCHQSYVVNVEQVQAYHSKDRQLTLKSGTVIPVSRRLASQVRAAVRTGEERGNFHEHF